MSFQRGILHFRCAGITFDIYDLQMACLKFKYLHIALFKCRTRNFFGLLNYIYDMCLDTCSGVKSSEWSKKWPFIKLTLSVQNDPSSEAVDSRLRWGVSFERLLQLRTRSFDELLSLREGKESSAERTNNKKNERTNKQKEDERTRGSWTLEDCGRNASLQQAGVHGTTVHGTTVHGTPKQKSWNVQKRSDEQEDRGHVQGPLLDGQKEDRQT